MGLIKGNPIGFEFIRLIGLILLFEYIEVKTIDIDLNKL